MAKKLPKERFGIISQIIQYERKIMKDILKESGVKFVYLVFDPMMLTKGEKNLIDCYYPNRFSILYHEIYKEFSDVVERKSRRFAIKTSEAIKLLDKLIDKLKLFDFCIISDKFIMCLHHEFEICIINRHILRR